MHKIATQVIINAPIEKVWQIFTDFDDYASWNPIFYKISGNKMANEQITVFSKFVTKKSEEPKLLQFKKNILVLEKYRFIWRGSIISTHFFCADHQFILEPMQENVIKFINSETFSGILSLPIFLVYQSAIKESFEKMNKALKERSEL